MRRVATALMASLLISLLGPVEFAVAGLVEQGALGDDPVTAASASATAATDATESPPDTGGGGSQDGATAPTAQSAVNGPEEGPSHVQGSNVPTQDSSSTSDAAVDNGAVVDQTSDQSVIGSGDGSGHEASSSQGDVTGQGQGAGHGEGHGQGQGEGQGISNGNDQGNGQATQQAHAGQQANASASAVSSGTTNDAATVLVGPAAAGDTGATVQTNATTADANATATHEATQDSGAAAAPTGGVTTTQTGAEQSASAAAQAQATEPENTAVAVRIEAPGNDGSIEQSNVISASADAVTQSQGSDTTQQANAVSQAQLESPANTAVELRILSDGDTAGGEQINSSSAAAATTTDASAGQATADATLTDPNNTFVSIRVNSDGATGTVSQENVTHESVNGVIATAPDVDHATAFVGADEVSGLAIAMTTDGANTDLRIAVENAGLDSPSEGSTFTWTWDLVVGDGPLACNISSSSGAARVDWTFDCDPNNLIVRTPDSGPQPVANAISWSWDWSRPGLPGWDWNRDFTITLPDCSGCTYVFDFRWITHEPTAPAASTSEPTSGTTASPVSVQQLNVTSASASATAGSSISQSITQTSKDNSERKQLALQQANVVQAVVAMAAAELRNATNRLVIADGIATQWNWAEAVVSAGASAQIWQHGEQHQSGNGSLQLQLILQSAQFTQLVSAAGAAAVRDGFNTSMSRRGDGIQSTSSTALGDGRAEAMTRQVIVQEQFGNESDQSQIAAQWAIVVQTVDMQAAAALAIGINETNLSNDAMNQRIWTAATSRSSAAASIKQTALQYQDADGLTQIQESYQLASIGQVGAAQARAGAGQIEQRYTTPPAGAPPITDSGSSGWTQSVSSASGTTRIVVVNANGLTEITVNGTPLPMAPPPRSFIVSLSSLIGSVAGIDAPGTEFTFTQGLASPNGPFAGTRGAEEAEGSSPRFPGFAPEHLGATAASAGTGGLGVLAALMALSLLRAPQRGRRLYSPAGRRPAVALLRRERPG
jgi:hypothetical protein